MLNQAYPLNFQELGIVSHGLVACYDFQGGGNKLIDRSGNGNHGQLGSTAGADTNDPTWTGQGLQGNGDDLINCGHGDPVNFNNEFSVFAVINPTIVNDWKQNSVVTKYETDKYQWKFGLTSSGLVRLDVYKDQVTTVAAWTIQSLSAGVPAYIGGIYDSEKVTTCKGTIGGNPVAFAEPIQTVNPDLRIGCEPKNSRYFEGDIYFVLLYNRALTPPEITQNYHALQRILAGRGVQI